MSEDKNWYDDDSQKPDRDSIDNDGSHGENNSDAERQNGFRNSNGGNGNGYYDNGYYGNEGNDGTQWGYNPYGGGYNPYYRGPVDPPGTNRRFGGAAFGCGIASLVMVMTGVFSIILGALGVLFASLSRRRGKGYPARAKAGMTMSVIGMIVGLLITVYSVVTVLQNPDAFYQDTQNFYRILNGEELTTEDYESLFESLNRY